MQTIIEGIIYDTETATLLARYDSNEHEDDAKTDYRDSLYKTPEGQLFLYGDIRGAKTIIPIDTERAIDWLVSTKNISAMQKWFPDQTKYDDSC